MHINLFVVAAIAREEKKRVLIIIRINLLLIAMAGKGRRRGRVRGRKRRAECEYGVAAKKIHNTSDYQDYPYSPPFSQRCSGRDLTSLCYTKIPKFSPPMRTLKEAPIETLQGNGDNAKPEVDDLSVEIISEIEGPKEIESSFNDAFEYVQGHRVKAEFAPLLKAIFNKYGDITRGTHVKSSDHLELICQVYQRLDQTNFHDLTCAELDGMISELRLLESCKVSVGWILERLEYLAQTKISSQYYELFKEQEAEFDASIGCLEKDLQVYEGDIRLLQHKISTTKAELVKNKAKNYQIKQAASDIKARVIALQKQSLVHGFL